MLSLLSCNCSRSRDGCLGGRRDAECPTAGAMDGLMDGCMDGWDRNWIGFRRWFRAHARRLHTKFSQCKQDTDIYVCMYECMSVYIYIYTYVRMHASWLFEGFSALNKLLGKNVYASQDQLGGPQVMVPNGVTHQVELQSVSFFHSPILRELT